LFCNFVMPEQHPRPFPNKEDDGEVEKTEEKEEEKKKREKCPKGTKRNKEGNCVDKEGNIVNKTMKVRKVIVIQEEPEEKEPVEKKKRKKCPNGSKRNKEGYCVDKDGNRVEEKEEEVEKKVEKKKKVVEKDEEEEEEEGEEEGEEEEEEGEEDAEEIQEKKEEKKKREKCPNGTRRNKQGDCVDKDGNIVNKTRKEKELVLLENPVEALVKPINYGMENGINACWLISSLQLLFHIPEFQQAVLTGSEVCNDKTYKRAYNSLKVIFKDLSKSKKAIEINKRDKPYYEELGKMIFKEMEFRGRQMDAHEAVTNIIAMFVPDKKVEPITLNANGIPIYHLFAYKSNNMTYCKKKGVITKQEINAVDSKNLMLFLPHSKDKRTIQESIHEILSLHKLEVTEKLERCKDGDDSFEKLNIFQNNNHYFLINLSRQDVYGRKINYSIEINKTLTLQDEQEEEVEFGLLGVICHFGGGDGGHYTYCSYDMDSKFLYEYSDAHKPNKKEPNISRYATVLLYRRKGVIRERREEEEEEEEEEEDNELRVLVDNADAIAKDDLDRGKDIDDYTEGGKKEEQEKDIDFNQIYIGGMTEEEEEEEEVEKDIEDVDEDVLEEEDPNDEENILNKMGDETYEKRIEEALTFLSEHEKQYLSPKGLAIYSPKYLSLLENISSKENIGLHLIYSQFRTLEGIGIFTLVLNANGFAQFRLKKGVNGKWQIKEKAQEKGKMKYALYTGKESAEEKELIRKIYNSEWNNIPSYLKEDLEKISTNNYLGEVIKCLMITASGSEGINLRNTRFVHLMEPYWNPVRTDQVIGRARRICSHQFLPEQLKTVNVYLYLMTLTKKQLDSEISNELKKKDLSKKDNKTPLTSDQTLFEISLEKEIVNHQLYKCIKESSIDCMVYSKANKKEGLTCLNFGVSTSDEFSYKPDYKTEENDVEQKLNQQQIDFKVRPFKFKGLSYVMNINTGDIYREDDYTTILGVMIRNPEGKMIPKFH
jgi:Ubiquitin carboxyl-terminal hydrolase/Helicase conserved C-terminal domain